MVFKWALIVFGLAAVVLFVLTKVIGFLNPPRPGRAGRRSCSAACSGR